MFVLCSAAIYEIIRDQYYQIAVNVYLETLVCGIELLMLSAYMFHGRINKMKRV